MIAFLAAAVLAALPNPLTTPGALNPHVTQANIHRTICRKGWTATIRPPLRVTRRIKARMLPEGVAPHSAELDHLVSLELGGSPSDLRNLWAEPWADPWGAHRKDALETFEKREVCAGRMTLDAAQTEIRTDWISAYLRHPELPPVADPHP